MTRVMVSLMVDFEAAFNPVSLVKTKFRDELTKALSRIDTLCADRNAMKGQIHQMSKTQLDINDRLIKLEQIWEYLEQHQKRSYKRRTQNKKTRVFTIQLWERNILSKEKVIKESRVC